MRAPVVPVVAVAVAGLAATAAAQSFTPRVAFRDHVLTPIPQWDEFYATSSDPIPIGVVFGAFEAQGFTNRGMFNFIGTVTVSDPANEATLGYRIDGTPGSGLRSPYNFGGVESIGPDGRSLYFDANRGSGQANGVTWNFGEPAPEDVYVYPPFTSTPAPGNGGGPDTWFPGLRFFVNIGSLDQSRDITVTVTGEMQAITDWFAVSSEAPEDHDSPGYQDLLPAGFVSGTVTATFTIHAIPAPPAAALLAMGGLAAARRRR